MVSTLKTPRRCAKRSKAPYKVSNKVKTWALMNDTIKGQQEIIPTYWNQIEGPKQTYGSRTEDQAVNPAISANTE